MNLVIQQIGKTEGEVEKHTSFWAKRYAKIHKKGELCAKLSLYNFS
jgi:hypothetical protein